MAIITPGCTAGELAGMFGSERLLFHRRRRTDGKIYIAERWGGALIFDVQSEYPCNGVSIGPIAGQDLADMIETAPQETIKVWAEPGRHIYDAGTVGEEALQATTLAQDVRWSRLVPSTPSPAPQYMAQVTKPRLTTHTHTPGIIPALLPSGGRSVGAAHGHANQASPWRPRTTDASGPGASVSGGVNRNLSSGDERGRTDAHMGAESYSTRVWQMFQKALDGHITFDVMATSGRPADEERRRLLGRISLIRTAGVFTELPDAAAIDCVIVNVKGACATR